MAEPSSGLAAPATAGQNTASGTPPAAGPNWTDIPLGTVGTLSGPAGASLRPGVDALQAWARSMIDGGLPVRLITGDDGGDPARHRAMVQDFVENKHVVAFVGNAEVLTGESSVSYLTSKRIPVVGGDGGGDWFYTSPVYFPQTSFGSTLLRAALSAFAEMAVPAGKTRLGTLQCVEAQICEDGDRIWNDEAPALGFRPVYRARASLAQPDFTAECLRARQAGVQTWIINLDATSLSRLAAACTRQGFRPTFGMGSSNAAPHLAKDPNIGELIVGLPYFPWFLRDTPGRQQFHDAMARYAPSLTPSAGHANGWSAAKLMERALRTVSGPVTSEAILAALWSLRGDDLDGVTAPLTYAPNQNAVRAICWANVTVRDGNWISPDGGRVHCRN